MHAHPKICILIAILKKTQANTEANWIQVDQLSTMKKRFFFEVILSSRTMLTKKPSPFLRPINAFPCANVCLITLFVVFKDIFLCVIYFIV